MKIYAAGLVTETNSFAQAPTGRHAFEEGGMRRGDGSGRAPVFYPHEATLWRLAAAEGPRTRAGLLAFAQPSGPIVRTVYEWLRDELLDGLRSAMPVDAVVLPLHGAMIADGYPDCEGDVIERLREIVGTDIPIGVELDLHCHLTEKMRTQADVIVAFKEYPHVDITERLEKVWKLTIATAQRKIRPVAAVFDCRMTDLGTRRESRCRASFDACKRLSTGTEF